MLWDSDVCRRDEREGESERERRGRERVSPEGRERESERERQGRERE